MNWYKKAKLIDKDPSEEGKIHLRCTKCGRFKTSPSGQEGDREEWKTEKEMDLDEKIDMAIAIDSWKNKGISHHIGISDGYCPKCYKEHMEELFEYIKNREKQKA